MEEKKLQPTQIELLQIKGQNLMFAQNAFDGVVKQIGKELGVLDSEVWQLSKDFTKLTKIDKKGVKVK